MGGTYMSKDKNSLIDLVPDSVDNAVKNITDKPTQNMGSTLADIWYLVFGGISQAAEKRKLKYSYALREFENELKNNLDNIPEDKRIEPDIQIIAPALEAAKYCVEKEELRELFSNLISSSMNEELSKNVHPIFAKIIMQLSITDAKLLKSFFTHINKHSDHYKYIMISKLNFSDLIFSLSTLESSGLIYTDIKDNTFKYATKNELTFTNALNLRKFHIKVKTQNNEKVFHVHFTGLGIIFCRICMQ